eukprot:m.212678 g.212678  ORF g.212678 m.212678 type:complete len:611 (-) comp33132_c3_seq3:332-2164(-)
MHRLTKSEKREAPYVRAGPKHSELDQSLVNQYSKRFEHRRQGVKCVKEKELMALSNLIRKKPEWMRKIFDKAITSKWIDEACGRLEHDHEGPTTRSSLSSTTTASSSSTPPSSFAPATRTTKKRRTVQTRERDMHYVIAELQLLAKTYAVCAFEPSPVDSVYQSSTLLSKDVLTALNHLATRLESEEPTDWHPFSDDMVLDLVHPSLFPYIQGQSQLTSQPTEEQEKDQEKEQEKGAGVVPKTTLSPYQWLPCDAVVDEDGRVALTSYINNLDPVKYAKEYKTIEQTLTQLLPMFEIASAQIIENSLYNRYSTKGARMQDWWETEDEFKNRTSYKGSADDDYDDSLWEAYNDNRVYKPVQAPEPDEALLQFPPPTTGLNSLRGKKIQVIIKFANIHLTPEKPKYNGGSWHVEGELQENIVASAIVYHSMQNVTESELSFRASIDEEFYEYEQCDFEGVERTYGFVERPEGFQEYHTTQILGSIVAEEGRTVVFSNDLQHCVQPFQLEDKTKPGVRKIMAIFLVDPNRDIISAKDVAPQQRSWVRQALMATPAIGVFPPEIIDRILDFVPGLMSMEEAKQHRKKLMEARAGHEMASTIGEGFHLAYSLCEH